MEFKRYVEPVKVENVKFKPGRYTVDVNIESQYPMYFGFTQAFQLVTEQYLEGEGISYGFNI